MIICILHLPPRLHSNMIFPNIFRICKFPYFFRGFFLGCHCEKDERGGREGRKKGSEVELFLTRVGGGVGWGGEGGWKKRREKRKGDNSNKQTKKVNNTKRK